MANRTRWAVGLIGSSLVLLAIVFVAFARQSFQEKQAQAASVPPPPPPPATAMLNVLIARDEIPHGAKLTATMFTTKKVPEEYVPVGVLVERDLDTLEGRFAKDSIEPRTMIPASAIADDQPVTPFHIPPGYRAVTILANQQTSVEGYVKPGSLVDVQWVYQDKEADTKKLATLVPFVRVLSVAGKSSEKEKRSVESTQADSRFTVTVLATEKDAKLIQLAAVTGELTLSLVGDEENSREGEQNTISSTIVSLTDLVKREKSGLAPPKCSTKNPSTGKTETYVLRDGAWQTPENANK
ncbi:MAG: Flp pilus assembly protein CpaB [Bdellovibrionota bacterium]